MIHACLIFVCMCVCDSSLSPSPPSPSRGMLFPCAHVSILCLDPESVKRWPQASSACFQKPREVLIFRFSHWLHCYPWSLPCILLPGLTSSLCRSEPGVVASSGNITSFNTSVPKLREPFLMCVWMRPGFMERKGFRALLSILLTSGEQPWGLGEPMPG